MIEMINRIYNRWIKTNQLKKKKKENNKKNTKDIKV